MAPQSKASLLWNPYEIFDIFPNTRIFHCLDPRCRRLLDRKDTKAACARLDKMARKDPSEIGEKSLARLAVLCFCSKHREDQMHEGQILAKVFEWQDNIKDVLEECGKEVGLEMEVRELKRQLRKAKQKRKKEVAGLVDEVDGLKEQLQRAVDENGMLKQQIAADEQCSTEKQMTLSKKMSQLQVRLSEIGGVKSNVELANAIYAREKEGLERELEEMKKMSFHSREVNIEEVDELKVQLQDSGARVEEAASHIGDLRGQLEESSARLESMIQEISKERGKLKDQPGREREMTEELNEFTNQPKENNTPLKESKSYHKIMERQQTAEVNKLRDQFDKSNINLEDIRQGSTTEASELRDQLARCKNQIEELKAAGSAHMVQLEREVNRCNYVLEDCETECAYDIAGSRPLIDSDEAVEQLNAASSHDKNQLTEEVHSLKEQLHDSKTASTMQTSELRTEIQQLKMLRHFSVYRQHINHQLKQGKVGQVKTANPALSEEVLRLREQARDVDRRLASQLEKTSVLRPRDVKRDVRWIS